MNMEVKIIDPDTGYTLPYNTPGEYCTRGYAVMKKYCGDEEATKKTIDDMCADSCKWQSSNPNGYTKNK